MRGILWKSHQLETPPLEDAGVREENLACEIGDHGFRGAAAAQHGAVNRSIVAVIAADVDAGTDANRPLRRFKGSGILLWLSVRNTVASQVAPRAGDRAEPIFHLRDDKAAELL